MDEGRFWGPDQTSSFRATGAASTFGTSSPSCASSAFSPFSPSGALVRLVSTRLVSFRLGVVQEGRQ